MERRNSGIFLLLIYILIAAYLLPLFSAAGSNDDLTRWAATVSLVEKNSFDISWTKDLIRTDFTDVTKTPDGGIYSNKSPGVTFLSAPFYAIVKVILGKPTPENVRTSWYILRFIIATIPLMVLAVWLIGMEVDTYSLGVLLFATPIFPYSLLYYSHILTAVLIYFAFRFIYDTRRVFPERCFSAGLFAGFAFLCESSAAVPMIIFGIGLLFTEPLQRTRRLLFYVSGVMPFLFLFALYNHLVFGSPIATVFHYDLTYPTLGSVYEFLISPSRGLFFFSPILIFAVLAFFDSPDRGFRRQQIKLTTIFLTATAVIGFSEKYGGDAVGARHLIIIIPLLLDSFFDGEIEDYSSLGRGLLFTVSFLLCTIPMLTYSFAPVVLQFPHNSFWQPLLYDSNVFTLTAANTFGLPVSVWTILPAAILLLFAIYFVWRDAKYPFRFAVGILTGFVAVGSYMFLPTLEQQAAKPFLEKVTVQKVK
ncbi:MAG: hypothetical protein R2681_14935 [Pyrinomonadaceae bacterium]